MLPESRSRTRLVTRTVNRAVAKQVGHERRRLDHLLEVVEHQQEVLVAQERREPLDQRLVTGLPHAQGLGDGGGHQSRVRDRRETDEDHAVREGVRLQVGGDAAGRAGSCPPRRDRSR